MITRITPALDVEPLADGGVRLTVRVPHGTYPFVLSGGITGEGSVSGPATHIADFNLDLTAREWALLVERATLPRV